MDEPESAERIQIEILPGERTEFQLALGQMVMAAGLVEWGIAGLIWQMLDSDEKTGLAVADGLTFGGMCSLVLRLTQQLQDAAARQQIKTTIKLAQAQMARRDHMVHAVWPHRYATEVPARIRVRPPRHLVVAVADIRDVTSYFHATWYHIQLCQEEIFRVTGRRPPSVQQAQ